MTWEACAWVERAVLPLCVASRGYAGLFALLTAVAAAAEGITIPKGTAVELTLMDGLSTRTAKVGDKFRTSLVRDLYVDGEPTLSREH